ncbi:MAG: hypothetical protein HYX75_19305 [Acidobacteria bacterium]|nr:hypothetical protein [Acidobacteriota bacterium]
METRTESLVVLVPGFLIISQIGPVKYFHHLQSALVPRLRRRGIKTRVFVASPNPTGGLQARAGTLLDQVAVELDRAPVSMVHFVGHSTGGLDLRFALDPRFRLRERRVPPTYRSAARDRIRTMLGARITIATPHRGTPFAVPWMWIGAGALERRLPFIARQVLKLVRLGVKPDSDAKRWLSKLGLKERSLEVLGDQLGLHSAPVANARRAVEFVLSIIEDRDAIGDLRPADLRRHIRGDDRLGADGPHCSSILTFAPPPRTGSTLTAADQRSMTVQHLAYAALWSLTAYAPCVRDFPCIPPKTWGQLAPAGAPPPDDKTNDGIVPTLSQPWGDVAGIFRADHMDVLGLTEWLRSNAGFSATNLSRVCGLVADRIAQAERAPRDPGATQGRSIA